MVIAGVINDNGNGNNVRSGVIVFLHLLDCTSLSTLLLPIPLITIAITINGNGNNMMIWDHYGSGRTGAPAEQLHITKSRWSDYYFNYFSQYFFQAQAVLLMSPPPPAKTHLTFCHLLKYPLSLSSYLTFYCPGTLPPTPTEGHISLTFYCAGALSLWWLLRFPLHTLNSFDSSSHKTNWVFVDQMPTNITFYSKS